MSNMTFKEGMWHAILGIDPQYEHMKTSFGGRYQEYMQGYNYIKDNQKHKGTAGLLDKETNGNRS